MAHGGGYGDHPRAEVPGIAEFDGDKVVLRCWPDKHWIGELRGGAVLRLWDRRCKKYVLFKVDELVKLLTEGNQQSAA